VKPRDEQKTDAIFRATLELVQEKGLAGITISEIAARAGLATGTVYIYFEGKDKLVNELYTACRKASADVYFKGYNASRSFESGFKTIWLNLVNYRIKNFKEAIFLEQCYHSPFITETTREMTKKLFQPLYSLMETGKGKHIIKNFDTFLLLAFMVSSVNEVIKHAHYSRKKLTKPTIEHMFSLCWDGLKA
jgi:AcrR family transcriptional regulator